MGGDSRRVGVVPRLPEPSTLPFVHCPGEVGRAEIGDDLVGLLCLLAHAGLRPVEFEEQRGGLCERGSLIRVDGSNARGIEELTAGNGHA